jgi:hypothetical protein
MDVAIIHTGRQEGGEELSLGSNLGDMPEAFAVFVELADEL